MDKIRAPKAGTFTERVLTVLEPGKVLTVSQIEELLINDFTKRKIKFVKRSTKTRSTIEYLNNFYNMDIRNLGYGVWCRVGEFVGEKYIDHIQDKF